MTLTCDLGVRKEAMAATFHMIINDEINEYNGLDIYGDLKSFFHSRQCYLVNPIPPFKVS